MKIFRVTCLGVCSLIASSMSSLADGSGPFSGRWTNVIFSGTGSAAQGCRYAEIETRSYVLRRGEDGKAAGQYLLQRQRLWITKVDPTCQIPDRSSMPDSFYRNDSWSLVGVLTPTGRLQLSGIHISCLGDCRVYAPANSFETTLQVDGVRVVDVMAGQQGQVLVYRGAGQQESEEKEAAAALRPLLQPLLDRDCNRFFESSLDGGAKFFLNEQQDGYCRAMQPLSALLSRLTVDKPSYSIVATYGQVLPASAPSGAQPLLLAGDAIVQRFFSSADGSSGVQVTAILRRQPDGTWRVRTLL